jgi:hypothetical protein
MDAGTPRSDEAPLVRDDARTDAIIAGTLCLMSCFAQHRLPAYAARIADNLLRLADGASLSAEFRAVCRRMAARWRSLEQDARRCEAHGVPLPDTRSLQ